MKALLICPAERREVAALSESVPLSNLPLFGKALLEHWIEHLVKLGAREILLLATDRPEQVRALVSDGCRWGITITVVPEIRELTIVQARRRYRNNDNDWLAAPHDVQVMDQFPGNAEQHLFTSYADWMNASAQQLPFAATSDRIGVREIKPGVWVGLHCDIAPDAKLQPPCWIGESVAIGQGAVVGPAAIIENGSFIATRAEIANSHVGPETYVGKEIELRDSIASGATLINWRLNSVIKIADPFLLAPLKPKTSAFATVGILSRITALLIMILTSPIALAWMARSRWRRVAAFRPLLAVRPRPDGASPVTGDTMVYYELRHARGWLRRWPQLWNIVRGQFAWVGNRPLSPHQAARLRNDFERLWLSSRLGWLCLADTESGCDVHTEEARAHASYYAVHANWWLDTKILLRAVFRLVFGISITRARELCARAIDLRPQRAKGFSQ